MLRGFMTVWVLAPALVASLLVPADTARAATRTTFSYGVTPDRASESARKLRATRRLTLATRIRTPSGAAQPPAARTIRIAFQNKVVVRRRAVRSTARRAEVEATGTCATKHRLAKGRMTMHAEPLVSTRTADLNVCIVKRKPTDAVTLALGARFDALGFIFVTDGHIRSGKNGPRLTIDARLPTIAGLTPALGRILVRTRDVRRTIAGRTIHLLNNPTRCPTRGRNRRRWRATQTISFRDGSKRTRKTATTKCRPG